MIGKIQAIPSKYQKSLALLNKFYPTLTHFCCWSPENSFTYTGYPFSPRVNDFFMEYLAFLLGHLTYWLSADYN